MKQWHITAIVAGLALMVLSLWVGAYGQHETGGLPGGSDYAWPAFLTALFGFAGGAAAFGIGLYNLTNSDE